MVQDQAVRSSPRSCAGSRIFSNLGPDQETFCNSGSNRPRTTNNLKILDRLVPVPSGPWTPSSVCIFEKKGEWVWNNWSDGSFICRKHSIIFGLWFHLIIIFGNCLFEDFCLSHTQFIPIRGWNVSSWFSRNYRVGKFTDITKYSVKEIA